MRVITTICGGAIGAGLCVVSTDPNYLALPLTTFAVHVIAGVAVAHALWELWT